MSTNVDLFGGFMSFGIRLSDERKRIGLNQKEFSEIAGVSKTSQVNYESGERSPNVEYLQAIISTGVDIYYILTGERADNLYSDGENKTKLTAQETWLLLFGEESQQSSKIVKHPVDYSLPIPEDTPAQEQVNSYCITPKSWEEFELIPFYDVEASAGAGSLVEQEQIAGEMAFRRDWLHRRGLQANQCALITARGDSMEPTIFDGDLLLVDTRANQIKDDAIYIIQTDHVLIVKRVQQGLDGTLIIISDNDKYQKQTISPSAGDKLNVAGRVRWFGHEL